MGQKIKNMINNNIERVVDKFFAVFMVFSAIIVFILAFSSLFWCLSTDSSLMMYIAFMIDKGQIIPYRDIFDVNLPYTYVVYWVVGHFSSFSDLGFRFADLIYLLFILMVTYLLVGIISKRAALFSAIIFGLAYLSYGEALSMQREYLMVLPLGLSLYLLVTPSLKKNILKYVLFGLFMGLACLIKPLILLAFIAVMAYYLCFQKIEKNEAVSFFLCSLLGFIFPLLVSFVYLCITGALPYFVDIQLKYYPIHAMLTGSHQGVYGWERLKDSVINFSLFGGHLLWIGTAFLGGYVFLTNKEVSSRQKNLVNLFVIAIVSAGLGVFFAGRFWDYHWLVFLYFIILLSSLCLAADKNGKWQRIILAVILLIVTYIQLDMRVSYQLKRIFMEKKVPVGNEERVGQIAKYLKTRLLPGDKVQPLDWTGGALQAMLMARAQIATPFIYDYVFYHDISNNYVRGLRSKFIKQLKKNKPRFIVAVLGFDKPWVWGKDTSREFPELQELINLEYFASAWSYKDQYVIYERRGKAGHHFKR